MRQLLILFLLCISNVLVAQATSIAGKITDSETGEELIGANVSLYKGGVLSTGASTDFTGNYSIKVDPGTYDVEVSYIGYAPIRITSVIIQAGRANKLDVQLGPGAGVKQWKRVRKTIDYVQINYQPLSIEAEDELSREELFNEAECND